MVNLIDITANTLAQNTFCFEGSIVDIKKIPVPIENSKFGILNFTAVTSSETDKELDFVFSVDCSGSMCDRCSDGRSKMQHIIHTLKNMIIFLHEQAAANSNITINAFDTKIYKTVERVKITDENLNEILTKIEKLTPLESTNIELALRETSKYIQELKTDYPTNIVNHIFMTDGEATDGSREISLLKSLVVDDIFNAFIGFGIEHDAGLLNSVGSVGKSCYHFIDKLESAGFIYGEILHSVIYKILTDCEIKLTNGLIYDFKTNSWVSSLKIGDIISEANKTYNIVSSNPDEFSANIQGKLDDLVILYPSTRLDNTDLPKHIFRQRTLQLMFEANDYCHKKREEDNNFVWKIPSPEKKLADNLRVQSDSLKRKLAAFMEEMKKFMSDSNLMDDKFMKNLCDDIYICFRTFDTRYGNMYCTSRQISQGSQRQYTVSNTLTDERYATYGLSLPQSRALGRNNNLPILQHEVSRFDDTPYLTPQATQVMRFVSSNIEDNVEDAMTSTQDY